MLYKDLKAFPFRLTVKLIKAERNIFVNKFYGNEPTDI
jgi:hypothetical protein